MGRLREALRQLNPTLPKEAREEALRKVVRVATPWLVLTNRAFHRLVRDGGLSALRSSSGGQHRLRPVTSTPIGNTDANTRAVFGDHI